MSVFVRTCIAEDAFVTVWRENDNMLVPYYLMASYLYYHCPDEPPILSDSEYDELCWLLYDRWRSVKHEHKKLVKRKDLLAGTGYRISEHHFPLRTKLAALELSRQMAASSPVPVPRMVYVETSDYL